MRHSREIYLHDKDFQGEGKMSCEEADSLPRGRNAGKETAPPYKVKSLQPCNFNSSEKGRKFVIVN